jgi:hypothetical protein
LYDSWEVSSNEQAALDGLTAATFDPEQTVIVTGEVPPPPVATNQNAGTVEFVSYAPRDIVLKSDSPVPTVLLLNDRFDPNWTVQVDGKPDRLFRCNYLMRGVYLPAGAHRVYFRFRLSSWPLLVSLTATVIALVLIGVVVITGRRNTLPAAPASPPAPPNEEVAAPAGPRKKDKRQALSPSAGARAERPKS